MGESLVKSLNKKRDTHRTEEPEVKKVDAKTFLAGVKKIEPVKIKGYVCLF